MTDLHLKPSKGTVVRDPNTLQPLLETGEVKPRTSYWLRRINEGDVVVMTDTNNAASHVKTKKEVK